MATSNTLNVGINVSDNGTTQKVVRSVQDLKTLVDQTALAAGKMNIGGTTGSRSVSEKAAGQVYSAQRGVAGTTGAGARNFAAESQGLGGLVRLYATFAANTFAAAAAFTALSNAMDTANMVKGLDQLGAASGRNLGALSKQLVATTNGAISIKDSMQAVAQMSSAGMGSENILRLGKVAEKASQALGINMSDAVSRLSRGITKLEPELLDELGIFTKIDESNQKYAASLGKSVSALTDFEKRQGFANAVLEEGNNKFGKIKIDANPYAQLSASLQNLAQTGLETVNTVLGPLIKLLASSPTALTAVIAGLAGMLIKQAIPAIGQYREALQAASEKSLLAVSGKTTASKAALAQKIAEARQDAEVLAEIEVTARDEATKKLEAFKSGSFAKSRARLTPILDKPVQAVTTKELEYLEAQAAKNLTSNAKLAASYQEVADTIKTGKTAEAKYAAIKAQEVLIEQELTNVSRTRQLADAEYRKLSEAAIIRDINLKTAAAVKELGYVEALKLAYAEYGRARATATVLQVPTGRNVRGAGGERVPELEKVSVSAISKTALAVGLLRSGITATITAVGGLISALSGWAAAAFIVYEVVGLAVEYFGNTTEQSKATSVALDKLSESGKGVARTLDDISSRSPFERLTVDSINARVTAFGELTTAMSEAFKAANAEMSDMNWMDKLVDFTKGIVGKDLQSKTAGTFAKSLQSAFAVAAPSEATAALTASIEKTLGVSITDIKGLEAAYKSMGGAASVEIQQVIDNLNKLSKEQQSASARSVELRDSYKESYKALNTFLISALPSDALSKIGQGMMADAGKLSEILKDPTQALVTMKAITSDINALKLFPPEVALQLSKYTEELNKLSYTSDTAETNLKNVNETINNLQNKKLKLEVGLAGEARGGLSSGGKIQQELDNVATQLQAAANQKKIQLDIIADVKTRSEDIKGVFGTALREQFVAGANILSSKIATEWAKAGTTVSNAVAGLLGDSLVANKLRADNEKQLISAQVSGIQSQTNLIVATDKLAAQVELSRVSDKLRDAKESAKQLEIAGGFPSEKALDEIRTLTTLEAQLVKRRETRSMTPQEQIRLSGGSAVMTKQFAKGDGVVSREDINFVQMLEAQFAQLAQATAQYKVVDINKAAKDLQSNAKLSQESLEREKASTQVQLDKLSVLEAEGKILSDNQLTDKKLLDDQVAALDYRQKAGDLDAQIAVKRIAQSALTTQADKDAEQININLLDVDARRVLAGQLLSKLALGQAALTNKIETRARSLLAVETETAQIRASGLAEGKTSSLEVDRTRLETLKATGKITDNEYIARKAMQDLSSEDLATEKSKQALKTSGEQKLRELDRQIDAEQDQRQKSALEAQQLALAANLDQELTNLNTLTEAKKAAIAEIAAYEKNKALTDSLTDAVITGLTEGGKEGSKKLRNIIIDELKKPITLIVRALVQPITNAATSAGSSMLSSVGSSMFSSMGGDVLAKSFGLESATFSSLGAAAAGSFNAGFSAGLAGTGSQFAAGAAASAEAGAAMGISSAGTTAVSGIGVAAGEAATALMVAAPYIAAAVALANAFGLFKKTKTTGTGLMGTLGGPQGIQSYDLTRTSGTLFKGPDYRLANTKTSELSGAINEAFIISRKATVGLAESLGLSSNAITNFTATLGKELIHGDNINVRGLKLEGLSVEEQMKKVQEALAVTTEDMAKLVLGTDKYNKLNEKSADALTRLSNSSSLINAIFKDLGFTLMSVSLEGADKASKLVDALGGVSEAQSKLGFVYDKFYTTEQKRANLTEKTTTALAKYNLELPKSREAYTALLDTTSKLGAPELFAALVGLAPAIDELLTTVEDNVALLAELADAEGNSTKATILRRNAELKAMSATDAAIKRRINALQDEKTAYDKLKSVLDSTVEGFKTSIKSLRDFQTSILTGTQSFTSPEQQLAVQKAQFASAIAAAKGPVDTEAQRAAAAQSVQDATKLGQELIATGNTLYASGQENVDLRAMIAEQIGGVADVLQYAQTDAEQMLKEATIGNEYLKIISDTSIKTSELWATYIAAKGTATAETIVASNTLNTQAPAGAVAENTQALNIQIAAQAETNRLLQKQLDLAAEQLRSNAIAIKTQTDQLAAAAAEQQAQAEYMARSQPGSGFYDSGQFGGP